jgi:hypothetical protein
MLMLVLAQYYRWSGERQRIRLHHELAPLYPEIVEPDSVSKIERAYSQTNEAAH